MNEKEEQFNLFGGSVFVETSPKKLKHSVVEAKENDVVYVDFDMLDDHPINSTIYRTDIMDSIKETILEYGFFDSQIVCKQVLGRYTILSGHRRVRAYKELVKEGLIARKPIPIHLRTFSNAEEETRFMIEMNTSSRDRSELDKLNETFAYASAHKKQDQLNNQEIVKRISKRLGLGESQLKKYMRLFDASNWDLQKASEEIGKYKSVNQWDELRSKSQLNLTPEQMIQKRPENFEQRRKAGRKGLPISQNQLFMMEPSSRFITKFSKVQNGMTDLTNQVEFLIKQKDLSKQGVKELKSIQSNLSKTEQALKLFLINNENKGESKS